MRAPFLFVVISAAAAPVGARADRCSVLQGNGVTQMCGSFVFNHGPKQKFTINYGPGTAFHVVGVPGTNTANLSGYGTFQCRGNNFYTTQYTVNNGTAPFWYAHLPGPAVAYDTETPAVFDVTLVAGACPGQ
jgi:hypothetical protein